MSLTSLRIAADESLEQTGGHYPSDNGSQWPDLRENRLSVRLGDVFGVPTTRRIGRRSRLAARR